MSGGYIYNRQLIQYLREHSVDVTYHAEESALPQCANGSTVIVDGILISTAARKLTKLPAAPVLLMHMIVDGFDEVFARGHIVATGEGTVAHYCARYPDAAERSTLIEPGVPAHWRPAARHSSEVRNLLCLANYLPGKGHLQLIDIMSRLQHLPWTLSFFGNAELDIEYFAAVRAEISNRGLQDRILLGGQLPHDEVLARLQQSDLLLHLSGSESFSMVTAEAIACGLPVLATRTGHWQQFAKSGSVHYVEVGNLEDTAVTLESLLAGGAMYQGLRQGAPRKCRTWDQVGQEFHRLLASLR